MILRSSPRKRLHLNGVTSPMSPQSNLQSPRKAMRTQTSTPQSHIPQKRLRITESPIAQQNQKTPLAKILKGLSQAQLINVIQELVDDEPGVEKKIRISLPMPDIRFDISLEKNYFQY